jgi:hypothetical protein
MNNLRSYKEESGKTYREIAAECGINVKYAHLAVNFPERVSTDRYGTVAECIGVAPDTAEEIRNKRIKAREKRRYQERLRELNI